MLRRAFLAIILAAALLLTAACGIIEKDAEVDKQTVIIEVAGQAFTKERVLQVTQNTMDYQAYMYSAYGMAYDPTDAQIIEAARDSAIESLIQSAVLEQKERELGLRTFTDEEKTALETEADATYQSYVDSVKSAYFDGAELTGEALEEAVAARMEELGYPTRADVLSDGETQKAYDKLREHVVKDVVVTEEEIKADYDAKVESAKANYESNPASYGTSASGGATVYYAPAGYRYVKNLLIKLSDEDSAAMNDLQAQIDEIQARLENVEASIADMDEEAGEETAEETAEETEDSKRSREILNTTKAELDAQTADLTAQLTAKREAAFAAIQPKVDEVMEKIASGEDFDALLETYGEDGGMKVSPAKEQGYLVCEGNTTYVEEFTQAAMALSGIGDVSPAVNTDFGVHILKYAGDLAEGPVPLEEVRESIYDALLSAKQNEMFTQAIDEWVTAAKAVVYKDRLN